MLDVACGTGLVARVAAGRVGAGGQVTGLDIHPPMLEVARKVAGSTSVPIEWQEGDAAHLPYPSPRFDVAFCQQGLQFFPDRLAALREIRRVLTPQGRVGVAVWSRIDRNPYFDSLADAIERHLGTEAATRTRSSFVLWDPAELQSLMTGAGFAGVETRLVVKSLHLPIPENLIPRHLAGTSLAAMAAAMDVRARAALIGEVAASLRSYAKEDGMTLPFEINLAIGHSS